MIEGHYWILLCGIYWTYGNCRTALWEAVYPPKLYNQEKMNLIAPFHKVRSVHVWSVFLFFRPRWHFSFRLWGEQKVAQLKDSNKMTELTLRVKQWRISQLYVEYPLITGAVTHDYSGLFPSELQVLSVWIYCKSARALFTTDSPHPSCTSAQMWGADSSKKVRKTIKSAKRNTILPSTDCFVLLHTGETPLIKPPDQVTLSSEVVF